MNDEVVNRIIGRMFVFENTEFLTAISGMLNKTLIPTKQIFTTRTCCRKNRKLGR